MYSYVYTVPIEAFERNCYLFLSIRVHGFPTSSVSDDILNCWNDGSRNFQELFEVCYRSCQLSFSGAVCSLLQKLSERLTAGEGAELSVKSHILQYFAPNPVNPLPALFPFHTRLPLNFPQIKWISSGKLLEIPDKGRTQRLPESLAVTQKIDSLV